MLVLSESKTTIIEGPAVKSLGVWKASKRDACERGGTCAVTFIPGTACPRWMDHSTIKTPIDKKAI